MDASAPVVSAKNLSRRFGERLVLDSINLEIPRGEAFGLIGPNGAGKTTLLRIIAGVLAPSRGQIHVFGSLPALIAKNTSQQIGYAPESPFLYDELTVDSLFRFLANVKGLKRSIGTRRVSEILARFDLDEVRRCRIGHLSFGFRRRVALAQAFLGQPGLVLLDEPTAGLDPSHRESIHEFLKDLRDKQNLIICTHDLDEAHTLTQRLAVIDQGRIIKSGDTQDILKGGSSLFDTLVVS